MLNVRLFRDNCAMSVIHLHILETSWTLWVIEFLFVHSISKIVDVENLLDKFNDWNCEGDFVRMTIVGDFKIKPLTPQIIIHTTLGDKLQLAWAFEIGNCPAVSHQKIVLLRWRFENLN